MKKLRLLFTFLLISAFVACDLNVEDPNSSDPSSASVQNLVTGVESHIKRNLTDYIQMTAVTGREAQMLQNVDPRYWELYQSTTDLDGYRGDFIASRVWNQRYLTIRALNDLEDKTNNPAIIAFAKTLKAHEYMIITNMYYDNGVRQDVKNAEKMGPLVKDVNSNYGFSAKLLDEAYTALKASTETSFPFNAEQFPTEISAFIKLNRALKARVSIYEKKWQAALDAVGESFIKDAIGSDVEMDLNIGHYFMFHDANNDPGRNPIYENNANDDAVFLAHNSLFADLETAGETSRVAEAMVKLASQHSIKKDGTEEVYVSDYGFTKAKNSFSDFPIIRNAELILIRAEAKLGLGNGADATADLNIIRNARGLTPIAGAATIDNVLHERRYELMVEGHRWVDLRRHNRLTFDHMSKDQASNGIVEKWPVPKNEELAN